MSAKKIKSTNRKLSFEQVVARSEQKRGIGKRIVAIAICSLLVIGILAMPLMSMAI